ncbi:MAG: NfeD family protein, partial [Anaerolineae bacterium]
CAGAALILLAFILFTADAFAPTHGALTTAGVISLLLGGLLLFDEATLGYRIPITPIVATSVILGLFFFFVVGKIVATLNMKPASGMERLMGATVIARTPLAPTGTVFADGARWQATIEDGVVEAGEPVEVVAVHGLKLTVRKTTPPSPAPPAGSPSPPPAEQSTGTSPAESPD